MSNSPTDMSMQSTATAPDNFAGITPDTLGMLSQCAQRIERVDLSDFSLNNHMAALTKANEVRKFVRLFGGLEMAKRHNVMNRYFGPHYFLATLTNPTVSCDGIGSCCEPALASIRRNSTNVIGRIFSRLLFSLKSCVAHLAAKAPARFALVLARKPWLNFKDFFTLRASVRFSGNGVNFNASLPREGIGWAQAHAPFVSNLVIVWHRTNRHMPFSAAALATKPRGVRPVRSDKKWRCADFANFFNHMLFISGTTGIATEAQRQGDLFISAA